MNPTAYVTLIKAQVLRETFDRIDFLKDIDPDYRYYLRKTEGYLITSFDNLEEVNQYLVDSRRITLKEWLESLDWRHVTIGMQISTL